MKVTLIRDQAATRPIPPPAQNRRPMLTRGFGHSSAEESAGVDRGTRRHPAACGGLFQTGNHNSYMEDRPLHRLSIMSISIWAGYCILMILAAGINLHAEKEALTPAQAIEICLFWCILIGIGIAGLVGFYGHILDTGTAAAAGLPAGSLIRKAVGFASLGFGIAGILCIRIQGTFRAATIAGYSVFLLGTAPVYGELPWFNLIMPIVLVALSALLYDMSRGTDEIG